MICLKLFVSFLEATYDRISFVKLDPKRFENRVT